MRNSGLITILVCCFVCFTGCRREGLSSSPDERLEDRQMLVALDVLLVIQEGDHLYKFEDTDERIKELPEKLDSLLRSGFTHEFGYVMLWIVFQKKEEGSSFLLMGNTPMNRFIKVSSQTKQILTQAEFFSYDPDALVVINAVESGCDLRVFYRGEDIKNP